MSVRRFVSNSSRETIEIGGEIASLLSTPTLLFLRGDLGAGKTTLVKGIAQSLGAAEPDEVTSPTFTLVHEYTGGRLPLYHLDFYRLRIAAEVLALGWEEYAGGDGLTVVEWGDKFPELMPSETRWFRFEILGGDGRRITEIPGPI